jgi:hypothetical protein
MPVSLRCAPSHKAKCIGFLKYRQACNTTLTGEARLSTPNLGLLRSRYEWKGELRAIGDVLRDQLNYMHRCGFDAFALRADKNGHDAPYSRPA